jgi:DNA-binding GntR family transcriptional regulator
VNRLTLEDIRHLYEIIGALEGAAVMSVGDRLQATHYQQMRSLNAEMIQAVEAGAFDRYYARNLSFHEVFLGLSQNTSLLRMVENAKHRLYDFPRRRDFLPDWESASTGEHAAFLDLLEGGDVRSAADYLRDVHWSFDVQQRFIVQYYFPEKDPLEAGGI